jgi:hypothetical protein
MAAADPEQITVNLAVVSGVCSGPPDVRTLESGRRLAALGVRTHGPGAHATSVPVTVWDPPAWIDALDTDEAVVVVGTVNRRFFRTAAGARGAKAEVEASYISRTSRRGLQTALRKASDALDGLG